MVIWQVLGKTTCSTCLPSRQPPAPSCPPGCTGSPAVVEGEAPGGQDEVPAQGGEVHLHRVGAAGGGGGGGAGVGGRRWRKGPLLILWRLSAHSRSQVLGLLVPGHLVSGPLVSGHLVSRHIVSLHLVSGHLAMEDCWSGLSQALLQLLQQELPL